MAKKDLPLADFQQWMQSMLLGPSGKDSTPQLRVDEVIKPSARMAAWQHLAIYQHGYTARLRSCMSTQFTALEYALGEDLFEAFADEYLKTYPSESYNLANLGDRFAFYLEETRPDKNSPVKEDWPDFMIELAQFECAINRIFDEKANAPLPLATTSTPSDRLSLNPNIHLFAFSFPTRAFYSAATNDKQPELPLPQDTYSLIMRKDFKLGLYDIHQEQYDLMRALQSGISWSSALRELQEKYGFTEQATQDATEHWRIKWLEMGFLCEAGST